MWVIYLLMWIQRSGYARLKSDHPALVCMGHSQKKISFAFFSIMAWRGPPEYYNLNLMQITWLGEVNSFFSFFFSTWKDFKNDAKIYRQKWNHADIRLQTIKDSDGENYCTELLKYKQKSQITCYSTTLWSGLSKNCLNVIMIIK